MWNAIFRCFRRPYLKRSAGHPASSFTRGQDKAHKKREIEDRPLRTRQLPHLKRSGINNSTLGVCKYYAAIIILLLFLELSLKAVTALETKLEATSNSTTHSLEPNLRYRQRGTEEHTRDSCIGGNKCEYRGFCKEIVDAYVCECYERFYKQVGDRCKDETNHCESNPCVNGGTCEPIWGNYFCTCDTQYHGRNCELENKLGIIRISRPQFLYDIEQFNNIVVETYLIFDDDIGSNFSFTYSTGRIDSVNFRGDASHVEDDIDPTAIEKRMQSDLKDKLSLEKKKKMFYFPYLYSQRENNTLYGEVITIEVLNGGLVQFSGEYEIYIIPKPLNCIPYLEIKDCGRSTEEMCKWERAKEHTVRGHVKRCYESSELKYIWGIFTMSKEVPFPLYKTLEGAKIKSNLKSLYEERNEYTIEPYNMSYGDYGFILQVVEKNEKLQESLKPIDNDMVRTLNSPV